MGKDYYAILGVKRSASEAEISEKFRVLAIMFHPQKNKQHLAQYTIVFNDICEAYEVLTTPTLRDIYDRYGEHYLKIGIPDARGALKGGYKFHGNCDEIFSSFFGTDNPFTICLDQEGKQISMMEQFQQQFSKAFLKKFTDLTITVDCTLNEFFFGCTKEIAYERVVLEQDNRTERYDVEEREIIVKPGMSKHSEIRYEK